MRTGSSWRPMRTRPLTPQSQWIRLGLSLVSVSLTVYLLLLRTDLHLIHNVVGQYISQCPSGDQGGCYACVEADTTEGCVWCATGNECARLPKSGPGSGCTNVNETYYYPHINFTTCQQLQPLPNNVIDNIDLSAYVQLIFETNDWGYNTWDNSFFLLSVSLTQSPRIAFDSINHIPSMSNLNALTITSTNSFTIDTSTTAANGQASGYFENLWLDRVRGEVYFTVQEAINTHNWHIHRFHIDTRVLISSFAIPGPSDSLLTGDKYGNIYYTSTGPSSGQAIWKRTLDGTESTFLVGLLPKLMEYSEYDSALYVVTADYQLIKVNPNTGATSNFGSFRFFEGDLETTMTSFKADCSGRLYYTASYNNYIFMIMPSNYSDPTGTGSGTLTVTSVTVDASITKMQFDSSYDILFTTMTTNLVNTYFSAGIYPVSLKTLFNASQDLTCVQSLTQCGAGSYLRSFESSLLCTVCPPGHFCTGGSTSIGSTCPSGTYCPSSTGTPITCLPGYYCTAGSSSLGPLCANGYSCPAGTGSLSDQTICPIGSFCPPGNTLYQGQLYGCGAGLLCTCPSRYYCSTTGLTEPTPCPDGYLCSTTGLTALGPLCPGGSYCQFGTAFTCPVGSYCPVGSKVSTTCTVGHMCSRVGLADAELCPAGSFCQTAGLSAPTGICPVGYFCPEGSTTPTACPSDTSGATGVSTCDTGTSTSANIKNAIIGSCVSGGVGLIFFLIKMFLTHLEEKNLRETLEGGEGAIAKETKEFNKNTLTPIVERIMKVEFDTKGWCGYRSGETTRKYVHSIEYVISRITHLGYLVDFTRMNQATRTIFLHELVAQIKKQFLPDRSFCSKFCSTFYCRANFGCEDLVLFGDEIATGVVSKMAMKLNGPDVNRMHAHAGQTNSLAPDQTPITIHVGNENSSSIASPSKMSQPNQIEMVQQV